MITDEQIIEKILKPIRWWTIVSANVGGILYAVIVFVHVLSLGESLILSTCVAFITSFFLTQVICFSIRNAFRNAVMEVRTQSNICYILNFVEKEMKSGKTDLTNLEK